MKATDKALLHWHQDLVDMLQRQPVQLARVCAMVYAPCVFLLWFMHDSPFGWTHYVVMAIDVLAVTLLCIGALSAFVLAIVGADAFIVRCVLVVCLSLVVLLSTIAPGLNNVPAMLRSVAGVMYFYFAACRPPKPKPPVRKMITAPGAA